MSRRALSFRLVLLVAVGLFATASVHAWDNCTKRQLRARSTQTIDLELQLDLVGRVLTPGAYSGTLNIRAVTQ